MTWLENPDARAQIVSILKRAGRRLTPQEIAPEVGKASSTVLNMLNALLAADVVYRKPVSGGPLGARTRCKWGLTGKPLPDVHTCSATKGGVERFDDRAMRQALGMPLMAPPIANAHVAILKGRRA